MSGLEIDMTGIIDVAIMLFNALFPIMIWPLGVIFGFGLIAWIVAMLSKFFKLRGG